MHEYKNNIPDFHYLYFVGLTTATNYYRYHYCWQDRLQYLDRHHLAVAVELTKKKKKGNQATEIGINR